ncbi:DUF4235 domain-containing protein [Haematomicrobium sanguinis]|uniref:DUF4235 domain-containing protein n=1 Tax=Haematomicrobium sanguinis TaxID=479106 RepID=UPI00047D6668|nr:DUF4235 domain-containing protein [Haematomicrobium sanguinis]
MNAVFKIIGAAISIGSGFVASKVVDAIWEKSTGKQPPKDDKDLERSLSSVLTFALVSSAVSAVISVLASRGTAKAIKRFDHSRGDV